MLKCKTLHKVLLCCRLGFYIFHHFQLFNILFESECIEFSIQIHQLLFKVMHRMREIDKINTKFPVMRSSIIVLHSESEYISSSTMRFLNDIEKCRFVSMAH